MADVHRDSSSLKILTSVDGLICTTCCGLRCIEGTPPETIYVDIAGITACLASPAPPSGNDFACVWVVSLQLHRYSSGGLIIDITAGCAEGIWLGVGCVAVYTGAASPWKSYFFSAQSENLPFAFSNQWVVGLCGNVLEEGGRCLGSADTYVINGYGGTVTVHL